MESFSKILGNPRPLYYLLTLPIFHIWGVSLVGARALAAAIGTVTLAIVYFVTQKSLGRRSALVATALLTLAPWHIFWSQNARFYTLVLLFYALSYVCFFMVLETDRIFYHLLTTLFLGLATLTHTIGALLIPLFIVHYLVLQFTPGKKPIGFKFRNILPYLALPIIGLILLELFRVFVVGTNSITGEFYTKFVNGETASFLGYSTPWIMFSAVLYSVGFPLGVMSAYGAFDLLFVMRKRESFVLVLGAYFPFFVLIILTLFVESITKRYAFMTLPFWVVLAASGVWRIIDLKNSIIGVLLIGVTTISLFWDPTFQDIIYFAGVSRLFFLFLVMLIAGFIAFLIYKFPNDRKVYPGFILLFIMCFHAIAGTVMYFAFQHGYRDNWIAPITKIQELGEADEIVLSHPYPVTRYYLGDRAQPLEDLELDSDMYAGQTIWLIEEIGVEYYFDGQHLEWFEINNCELIDEWDNYAAGTVWPMRLHRCSP